RLGDCAVGKVVRTAPAPFAEGQLAFHTQIGTCGVDQPELAGARKMGADDFGYVAALGVAIEVGNGYWILRGAHTGNVYSELGMGLWRGHRDGGSQYGAGPATPRCGIAADCSGRAHI